MTTETAVARREQTALGMPIQSFEDVQALGNYFARSGMFGAKTPEQGAIIALTCHMERVTPLDFIRTWHIIDGKLSMKYDKMLANFRQLGGQYRVIEMSDTMAKAWFSYKENEGEYQFTFEDADQAGFSRRKDGTLKDNWKRQPKVMLFARLVSSTLRWLCPEVVAGVYAPEEVMDFDNDAPVTVAQPSAGPASLAADPVEKAKPVEPIETAEPTPEPEPAKEPENKEPEPQENKEPEATGDEPDFDVMPIGNAETKGKKWSDFTDNQLNYILGAKKPEITKDHIKRIKAELAKRKKAAKKK